MKSLWAQAIKYVLIASLFASLLAGCGPLDLLSEEYPLEAASGSGKATSYVYRAAGEGVPDVAEKLIAKRKPEQQSEESTERMFLVYGNEIIHLQQDPDNPEDTLIEVSSREYVRQNYNPGFLEGYLLATIINSLFDDGWHKGGDYRGYGSKDTYSPKETYRKPTVDDKKNAPPMTVDRSGSIVRRSPTADSKATVGERSPTSSPSSSTGKVVRESRASSKNDKQSVFKKSTRKVPKISKGTGKVFRRR